ncbi:hypothetical protein ZIOFF_030802 [Zingiber officinale]|uniref:Uncharacterized protein n=1 Tax=Zingiber officinale TaxID=94328 RepID=A0A8J5GRH8_ZINOF|nr:hypothetical protein ZIOFF_030802 [Zingiber officinale]
MSSPAVIPRALGAANGSVLATRFGYSSLERQRQRLPVFKYRDAILYLVENHATTIIVGETGSGKTTQIPQYLKEAGWAEGGRVIACTQPRRLAVQSVASRVAEEMGVKIGEEVGYTIRFEDQTNPGFSRNYSVIMVDEAHERSISTDMLLGLLKKIQRRRPELRLIISSATIEAKSMSNFFQNRCFVGAIGPKWGLVVAHRIELIYEKDGNETFDQLLILVKEVLEDGSLSIGSHGSKPFGQVEGVVKVRPFGISGGPESMTLGKKVLEHFAMDSVPNQLPAIVSVEGKGYTVDIYYVEEPVSDYLQTTVDTVLLINEKESPGDILVFLTGQDDIDAAVKLLTDATHDDKKRSSGLLILPLFSGLSRVDQDLVFAPTPRGKRKVVISTNIAETSLTLEGVVYVVDSGFSKQRFYNPVSDIESLVVAPISKASARQRAGRAGRVRPGKCFRFTIYLAKKLDFLVFSVGSAVLSSLISFIYCGIFSGRIQGTRLYTEDYFLKEMAADGIPEMQRSNLVSCVIQLKALGIDNILGFDWLASPPPEAMVRALEVLYSLSIVDDDVKLTSPIGYQIAEVPMDPMVSKMVLSACDLGCSEEMTTIAASLSVQSIWVSGRGAQKASDEVKLRFAAAEGDHITFLNVYKGFINSGKSSQWCYKNYVNYHAMKKVVDVKEQLCRLLRRFGLALKSCEQDTQAFHFSVHFVLSHVDGSACAALGLPCSCFILRKAIIAGFFANSCYMEVCLQATSTLFSFIIEHLFATSYFSNLIFSCRNTATMDCTRQLEVLKKYTFILPLYCSGSSLASQIKVNPKWVVYHSLVSTDKHYMRNVIAIDPSWLIEAAPHFYQTRSPNLALY